MSRVISPPKSDWSKLRQPLEEGEQRFIEYLDKNLHKDWEIYIQPHMNGLCPDVVILNKHVGIGVFEVKNWNFKAMNYSTFTARSGRLHLKAKGEEGKEFIFHRNPVDQLLLYRKEIIRLYAPALHSNNGGLVVSVGLVLPSATYDDISDTIVPIFKDRGRVLFDPEDNKNRGYCVITQESFAKQIEQVLPTGITRFRSQYMNGVIASQIRPWLIEPDANQEQREPLIFDETQERFVNERTKSGYRRIKGSAGSGKSMVLVGRATKLMREGKSVLVTNFNITLLNYLTDLAVRDYSKARNVGTWLHFHFLCGRLCYEAGLQEEYAELFKNTDEFPENDKYCGLVEKAINIIQSDMVDTSNENQASNSLERYDAILVDEGQDFNPRWWQILRRLLKENGEMLLVADSTQDIYDNAGLWTEDVMSGSGFSGAWAILDRTYRLPENLIPLANNFAKEFLQGKEINLPKSKSIDGQETIDLEGGNKADLYWMQSESSSINTTVIEQSLSKVKRVIQEKCLSYSDLTILVQTHRKGKEVCDVLESKRISYIDIFGDSEESHRKKMFFYKGSTKVKISTLHSFKGWEAKAILIFIDEMSKPTDYALFYTGITRLKASANSFMYIVCADSQLEEYGKSWC